VARFEHDGKRYTIHERANICLDGSTFRRRFILDEFGSWSGDARTVREARKVLDKREKQPDQPFTPGPWEAGKSGVYGQVLCVCRRHEQAGDEWPHNARLIAAAPELLTAVIGLLRRAETTEPVVLGDSADAHKARRCYAEARAAVAKALGKTT
jgi:hypothetical protein